MGQMGMSFESFMNLTPGQFQEAYNAFRIKVEAGREASELLSWQVARWQAWRTLCPPKGKSLSVLDMIELPGDEKLKKAKKAKPSTEQRFKQLAAKWRN